MLRVLCVVSYKRPDSDFGNSYETYLTKEEAKEREKEQHTRCFVRTQPKDNETDGPHVKVMFPDDYAMLFFDPVNNWP